MINLFPYFLSLILGFLFLRCFIRADHRLQISLQIILSLFLGLGLSGFLVFLYLNLFGSFHAFHIQLIFSFFFLVALAINITKKHSFNILACLKNYFNLWRCVSSVCIGLIWIVIGTAVTFMASQHPFGEWDAWALWNMKLKFLVLGGESWTAIVNDLHWHTQPDYPLMLPLINTWVFTFNSHRPESLVQIPMVTAIVLTLGCGILLYAGLRQFLSKSIAFFGSILFMLNPYFQFLSTAQYADILLASFFLMGLILLMLLFSTHSKSIGLLNGISLGMLTFVKNEGIVLALIIVGISSFILFFTSSEKKKIVPVVLFLWLGVLLGAVPTIFFKIFLAPPNRDITLTTSLVSYQYFNLTGIKIIWEALTREILHKRWTFVWIYLLSLSILGIPKVFKRNHLTLILILLSYSAVILYVYLTTANFDLSWRLKSTLPRIIFTLMPSLFFIHYFILFNRSPQTGPSEQKKIFREDIVSP